MDERVKGVGIPIIKEKGTPREVNIEDLIKYDPNDLIVEYGSFFVEGDFEITTKKPSYSG